MWGGGGERGTLQQGRRTCGWVPLTSPHVRAHPPRPPAPAPHQPVPRPPSPPLLLLLLLHQIQELIESVLPFDASTFNMERLRITPRWVGGWV